MTTKEIQELVNSLLRGIDKKTEFTIAQRSDAAEPAVTVQLRNEKRTASVQLSESLLTAAQTDLMQRNRIRTALKRAHDKMWDKTGYIFSTKMESHKIEAGGWFQPARSGRPGGGGRR